jgi:glycosyltransferase involved in cell wall biosynthesis
MTRLRVLHVVQNLNYGGMERVLADLIQGLDPERFDLHVLTLQYRGRFSEGLERFATLHQSPSLPRFTMVFPSRLARVFAAIAPHIVHTHSGVWYKGSLAARAAGVPRVMHTEHGRKSPDPWTDRMIDRLASRRTDVVVAVSAVLESHLRSRVVSRRCRVRLVSNGIDTGLYAPRDAARLRAEFGLGTDVGVLGSVGRLEPIKGYDVMIRAYAELLSTWDSRPRPVLLLAGDGSERDRLGRLASELGVEAGVRFLGWRDDTVDLLNLFDVFTLASRSEGTSISLLEAMSTGRCPVVTDVGGNATLLGEDLRHRLVPAEEPAALAAAWHRALVSAAERRQDGSVARARVVEQFGVRAMVDGYASLYSELGASAAG